MTLYPIDLSLISDDYQPSSKKATIDDPISNELIKNGGYSSIPL